MVSALFGAKNLMRHVLTLKDAMYNRWTVYSKRMKLSFKEASFFWRCHDEHTKSYLARASKEDTTQKKKDRLKMQKKVNSHKPLGPLGSNDPVLPINEAHLHGRLNAESDGLSRAWKKSAVGRWF